MHSSNLSCRRYSDYTYKNWCFQLLNYNVAQQICVSIDIALTKGLHTFLEISTKVCYGLYIVFMLPLPSLILGLDPSMSPFLRLLLNLSLRMLHILTFSYDSLISLNFINKNTCFFFGHKHTVRNFRIRPLKKTMLTWRNRLCCCCFCSCSAVGWDMNIILCPGGTIWVMHNLNLVRPFFSPELLFKMWILSNTIYM